MQSVEVTNGRALNKATRRNTNTFTLETSRLILRQWQESDYAEFARMNADPEVMRYFPKLLTREESDALTDKFAKLIDEKGWGFWSTQTKADKQFIGLVGLNWVDDLPFPECIEVGWRLDRPFWGKGFASEAAVAALHFAFSVLKQDRVAAFTTIANSASRKVMSRIGMADAHRNFLHPRVPADSGLQEHVYYEIERRKFDEGHDKNSVSVARQ